MAMSELQALLDAAVDAIIVIDDRGAIATFNAAAERLFGYAAADVLGKPVALLMPEPYHSEHKGYIDRYLATGEPRIIGVGREVVGLRANGETFPIALSVGEAHTANGRRFVGIIRDLSAQRAAELRSRSIEGRLAHVGRFDLMGEMAAGIAHEINQPLSAIATYAQAARRILEREQPAMTTLIDVCGKIDEQALRAGRVIENLRKFIKKQDVRTETLDVNAVVKDIMNLVDADAHAEGIHVTTKYGDDLALVRGNEIQLQQVLLNLTRNAVDAMRGSLNKHLGILVETQRAPDGGVSITVADHGPGVSAHLGDAIFHPFVTTKREGLGVGLAISRTIVQSCGGTLIYRDNPAGGAVFAVELPIAKDDHSEQPKDEAAAER
jgi:two-component system, LuxR family, sensor kinase FixL